MQRKVKAVGDGKAAQRAQGKATIGKTDTLLTSPLRPHFKHLVNAEGKCSRMAVSRTAAATSMRVIPSPQPCVPPVPAGQSSVILLPPAPHFSRRVNTDGEGVSAQWQ